MGTTERTRHWKLAARAVIGVIFIFCWIMDGGNPTYLHRVIAVCFPHGGGGRIGSYG